MLRAQHAPFLAVSEGLIGNPWRQSYWQMATLQLAPSPCCPVLCGTACSADMAINSVLSTCAVQVLVGLHFGIPSPINFQLAGSQPNCLSYKGEAKHSASCKGGPGLTANYVEPPIPWPCEPVLESDPGPACLTWQL